MAKGRPNPADAAGEANFEMTSMIDVTFLLLIFFMCVTEMSDASKSKIKLPRVNNGEEDINPPPGRMLINVLAEGIDEKGQPIKEGQIQILRKDVTENEFKELLKQQVALAKTVKVGEGTASEKPVLIRSDKRTKYKSVRRVMEMCVEKGMYKISFTALAPKGENAPPSPHD